MPTLDCGIDIGSTNLKVVLVAPDGTVVDTRTVPSPRGDDGVGPVTDATALVALLEELIIAAWREAGGGPPLRSIAASGVGEDGVGVDAGMVPTGFAIPWFDVRARDEAARLAGRFGALIARSGIAIGPDRTAAKWLWLATHRPDELMEASSWVALTDYPAAWWSGRPFMSASLAPRTACFDVFERNWIGPLLVAARAPPLPPIVPAGYILGGVTRGALLASGAASGETLVVAGGHDHPMAAAAVRRYDPGAIVDSLGTANLIYGETDGVRPGMVDPAIALSLPPAGGEAIACLGVLEMDVDLAAAGAREADIRGFLARDRLAGAPPANPGELAAMLPGTRGIRRALERESFAARRLIERMTAVGVPPGPIYATGGRARSRGFIEMRASVFGRAIMVVEEMELSALGAAQYAAGAATGEPACLLRETDIKSVGPLPEWMQTYDALRETQAAGSGGTPTE